MDFYFDRVLQPGQAGVIRIHFATKDVEPGPAERTFELQTNDPKHRLIKVTVTATVKPLPGYAKRLGGADIAHGETLGPFVVWPAVRPTITLERGERLPITLRVRPAEPGQRIALVAASDAFKLTRETNGDGYLLTVVVDSPAASANDSPARILPLILKAEGGNDLALQITVNVPGEVFAITPQQVDFGEVSLEKLRSGAGAVARLGIRKAVGSFEVKSLGSTLEFLQVESQTIVPGTNYLIRLRLDPAKLPKPGNYAGIVRIETNEPSAPRVEVRVKVVVKD